MSFLKKIYYSWLDVITLKKGVKRKINNHTVRFPSRWSRYYQANYEEENYRFLEKNIKPGMQVLDIGAHIGLFSTITSQLTGAEGRVICFEPTPGTFKVLAETLRLNKCANVTHVQAAVGAQTGLATFYVSDVEACNSNSLVNNKDTEKLTPYDVSIVTIDSIVEKHQIRPSLIKIDAEGAELDVLKGGAKTFADYKPIIILGLHPEYIEKKGDSLESIWNILMEHQYHVEEDNAALTKEQFCGRELFFDVNCF